MKHTALLGLSFLVWANCLQAQKGCTDPQASNYGIQAKINDGSCVYAPKNISPALVCPKLNDSLAESSGLIYYDGMFWTHNDSDNPPCLYAFDSLKGKIIHRTFIGNKPNIDWEDMSQDSQYIYIGDFGNNAGNRKDLKILVIKKSDLKLLQGSDTVNAAEINFSFADQLSFSHGNQDHDFDMEAFCVIGDSLHLFSKNWVDKMTRHYVMPKTPGNHSLQARESFSVNGQITGAYADEQRGIILLTGYNKTDISSFIWIMWDMTGNRLMSGNRRRIELGTVISLGQNEAVCFKGKQVYISNEKYLTEAGLRRIEVEPFLSGKSLSYPVIQDKPAKFTSYQSQATMHIKAEKEQVGQNLHIYNSDGRLLRTIMIEGPETSLEIDDFMEGVYILKLGDTVLKVYLRQ
jgi:hypothetical protein